MPATQLCRGRTAGRQLDTRRRRELCPLPGLRSAADGLAPNHQLQGYLHERKRPVAFTRSRPYHKDDNAHVEQKNWMWPRQLLGYGRPESAAAAVPLCTLYQEAWGRLMNFFLPGLKLERKWRERSAWKKQYEPERTAYQRLLDAGVLGQRARRELRERYESLDPFVLKREVECQLKPILSGAAEVARRPAGNPPQAGGVDTGSIIQSEH